MTRRATAFISVLLLSGCSGIDVGGTPSQTVRPVGDGGIVPFTAQLGTNGKPVDCAVAEDGPPPIANDQAFLDAIVGQWVSCSGSVFCTDELGIEMRSDGRWSKLYAASATTLMRGKGFDEMGAFIVPTSASDAAPYVPPGYVTFAVDGGGFLNGHVSLSATPRHMRLDNMGVCIGDYTKL
jgi:hypothetical protein